MRILAARFPDQHIATTVRDLLRHRLHLEHPDVDIAPLGMPSEPETTDTLLAGRVPDEQAAEVTELVRQNGGEVVANVDERWTMPRSVPPSSGNSVLRMVRQQT